MKLAWSERALIPLAVSSDQNRKDKSPEPNQTTTPRCASGRARAGNGQPSRVRQERTAPLALAVTRKRGKA
jgi:hypothetical protein